MDEIQEQPVEIQKAPEEGVKIKESAIEKPTDESAEDRMKRLNISNLPGHTYETEHISKQRQDELKSQDSKDYEYKANGYTVSEFEQDEPEGVGDDYEPVKAYKVTAEGFEKVFASKNEAAMFVETHAAQFKDMPATFPSV
jgi:hypothetical protein